MVASRISRRMVALFLMGALALWSAPGAYAVQPQATITAGAVQTAKVRQDISDAAIAGMDASYAYCGKAVKPTFQVITERCELTDNGDGTATATQYWIILEEGRDYTVSYRRASQVGTARVIVTGKGDYQGTLTRKYDIVPARAKVKSAKAGKGKLTVRVGKVAGGCSYQFAYKKHGGHWVKTVGKGTKKTLSHLKRDTAYDIKVRAFKKVGGKRYYGAWSKVGRVTTKP